MVVKKRIVFRWLVDTFDSINFWFQDKLNLNPKRASLEKMQDMVTLEELDRTVGKSLDL